MQHNQEKLAHAMNYALEHRPKVGGFPFLAETLRKAGVTKNTWYLPGATSVYVIQGEVIVQQGTPLVSGMNIVPSFNQELLVDALRTDQSGKSTFPEFLHSAWNAGVVRYEVDFDSRIVTYFGAHDEKYSESYEKVEIE